jgi:hypothetical protein
MMIRRWEVVAIYPGTGAVHTVRRRHLTRRGAERYRDLVAVHGETLGLRSELRVRRQERK